MKHRTARASPKRALNVVAWSLIAGLLSGVVAAVVVASYPAGGNRPVARPSLTSNSNTPAAALDASKPAIAIRLMPQPPGTPPGSIDLGPAPTTPSGFVPPPRPGFIDHGAALGSQDPPPPPGFVPIEDMPADALGKLTGSNGFIRPGPTGRMEPESGLSCTISNGSPWNIVEVTVEVRVLRADGRLFSTTPYRLSGALAPFQSGFFGTQIGSTLLPGQRWEWSIVGARGCRRGLVPEPPAGGYLP